MSTTTEAVGQSQALYNRAKQIIPGGTQLLSKRPEMFLPDHWPAYYERAKGCDVWDLDGRQYMDAAYMGVGANVLGYANESVDNAVIESIRKGTNTTLNAPEEVELAELLLSFHPWADSVRYTKTGGEAMAVAVRIARAATGKHKVLFCGYHGWHDWYISSNLADDKLGDGHLIPGLEPNGVPRQLLNTAIPFTYNQTEEFLEKLGKHGDDVACIVIESVRNFNPDPHFFAILREEAHKRGIVLILDEITAGFRLNMGGAHLRFDIEPDMAVFGKAFSNGYPMGAIMGKQAVMEAAQTSFISSLFWTERTGLAATLATIREMQRIDSPSRVVAVGEQVQAGWKQLFAQTGIDGKVMGLPSVSAMAMHVDHPLGWKTYLTQEMLDNGYLATTALYASVAHEGRVEGYLQALGEVFTNIAEHLRKGTNPEALLRGPVCHSGFKRLT